MRYHIQPTPLYVIQQITARPDKLHDYIPNFDGTVDDAVAVLRAETREVLPVDTCDHYDDATGRCLGHAAAKTEGK